MEKNWLIRTKNNHILGPVSKEKLLELYSNGSIKAEDEVTSGNGYWFFIREKDLVDKYLFGGEAQGFNPVSEADDVVGDNASNEAFDNDIPNTQVIDINQLKGEDALGASEFTEESYSEDSEEKKN